MFKIRIFPQIFVSLPRQFTSFSALRTKIAFERHMKLEHLSIVNYKNIREADLDFSSGRSASRSTA